MEAARFLDPALATLLSVFLAVQLLSKTERNPDQGEDYKKVERLGEMSLNS